jgi:hypothetical protein
LCGDRTAIDMDAVNGKLGARPKVSALTESFKDMHGFAT